MPKAAVNEYNDPRILEEQIGMPASARNPDTGLVDETERVDLGPKR
jgi:hypothetical protein